MPPATRRRTTKRAAAAEPQKVIVIKTELAPIRDLHPYFKNPRIGDVEGIAKSLHLNGQFRPIIVNIGTHTGRPNEILAGNHTWIGARRDLTWEEPRANGPAVEYHKPSWDEVLVSWVDVDEAHAARINLVDNRTADAGTYDEQMLAEVFDLASIEDLSATGFKPDEVEDILSKFRSEVDDALGELEDKQERDEYEEKARQEAEEELAKQEKKAKSFSGVAFGEENDAEDDDEDDQEEYDDRPTVEDADEELEGLMQFKPPDGLVFDGIGAWGIPKLRNDRLMTFDDLPAGLETWAGSATKNDADPSRWWLYNYGVDSTSGMRDISKVIVSFYCFDQYFENWWYYPEKYFGKLINSKITMMLTPNFSQDHTLPKVESLWQLYRARWIGRYAQECGLKVCPDITWRDGDIDWLDKQVLSTLPKGLPLIAVQLQTIDEKKVTGGMQSFIEQIELIFSKLEPQGALVYAGPQGRELIKKIDTGDTRIRTLGTRLEKLSVQAKTRKRKKTI